MTQKCIIWRTILRRRNTISIGYPDGAPLAVKVAVKRPSPVFTPPTLPGLLNRVVVGAGGSQGKGGSLIVDDVGYAGTTTNLGSEVPGCVGGENSSSHQWI